MPKEEFINYIWQYQQFTKTNLLTTDGQALTVLNVGFYNQDAGPDFSNARLVIAGIEWAGNVEIHSKASDWFLHHHEINDAYENVVLHVVWEADKPVFRKDGTLIPTIALKDKVAKDLILKYNYLIDNQLIIPCQEQFGGIEHFYKIRALDAAMLERLGQKSRIVYEKWEANNRDWEQTTFELLARNFGFKINAEPFEQLAKNLPLKVLQKHRDNRLSVEAMVFGVAGLLQSNSDVYASQLKQEYDFYKAKFELADKQMNAHEWKFLRLRPANFPTIRLAQFAALMHAQQSLFSLFTETKSYKKIIENLKVKQNSYWQKNYDFGKESARETVGLGKASIENIIINTVVPLLFTYGQYIDNQELKDRAIAFLEEIKAEENHITAHWEGLGLPIKTAFDSQASIELFNNFCSKKQCLRCAIGRVILK